MKNHPPQQEEETSFISTTTTESSQNSSTTTTENNLQTSQSEIQQSQTSSDFDEYVCPECKKGFSQYNKYTNIQQLIRNNMIACDICNRWYHLLCCSEQLYNAEQTGNLKERIEFIFRKSVKAISLDENHLKEKDHTDLSDENHLKEKSHHDDEMNEEKAQKIDNFTNHSSSSVVNPNTHSNEILIQSEKENSNFDLEMELRKIETQIQSIPFFICTRCLETRNLYKIVNSIKNSSHEEDNSVRTIPYFRDEIRDPFLFFDKYTIQEEEQATSSSSTTTRNSSSPTVYYIITKANNEDQIRRFSYCNFLATREDARFISSSKVTFQQMVECSKRNIEHSIEKSLELSNFDDGGITTQDENSQNDGFSSPSPSDTGTTGTPSKFSSNEYQHHLLDIIKEKALESCIRPENEAFILLRVQVNNKQLNAQNDKEESNQTSDLPKNNTCECIGYFTCYFEFLSKTMKKYILTDAHSTFKQLFITPKHRKKGHAQRMVTFFLTLSTLLLDTSKIEGYRYFSSHTSIEYPNYSMCSLLERLNMNIVKKIELGFNWNDLDQIRKRKSLKRKSKEKKDQTLMEEDSEKSSESSSTSDDDSSNFHKRKLKVMNSSEENQDETNIKKRKFQTSSSSRSIEEKKHSSSLRSGISDVEATTCSLILEGEEKNAMNETPPINKKKQGIRYHKREITLLATEHLEKLTEYQNNSKKSIIAFLFKTKLQARHKSLEDGVNNEKNCEEREINTTPTEKAFRLEIFLPLNSFNFDLIDEKEFKVEFM